VASWYDTVPLCGDRVALSAQHTIVHLHKGCQGVVLDGLHSTSFWLKQPECRPICSRAHGSFMIEFPSVAGRGERLPRSKFDIVRRSTGHEHKRLALHVVLAQARAHWPPAQAGRVARWAQAIEVVSVLVQPSMFERDWARPPTEKHHVHPFAPAVPLDFRVHLTGLYAQTGVEPLGSFDLGMSVRAPACAASLCEEITRTFSSCSATPLVEHKGLRGTVHRRSKRRPRRCPAAATPAAAVPPCRRVAPPSCCGRRPRLLHNTCHVRPQFTSAT
jgi:hypothetical protein